MVLRLIYCIPSNLMTDSRRDRLYRGRHPRLWGKLEGRCSGLDLYHRGSPLTVALQLVQRGRPHRRICFVILRKFVGRVMSIRGDIIFNPHLSLKIKRFVPMVLVAVYNMKLSVCLLQEHLWAALNQKPLSAPESQQRTA